MKDLVLCEGVSSLTRGTQGKRGTCEVWRGDVGVDEVGEGAGRGKEDGCCLERRVHVGWAGWAA